MSSWRNSPGWIGNIISRVVRLEARVDKILNRGTKLVGSPDTTTGVFPSNASAVKYDPADITDWTGDVDPGDVDDALDQLAQRVEDHGTTHPHTLLSATHTDTSAGTVVRGDIIRGNSTPAWERLAKGATQRYLQAGSLDVAWQQISHLILTNVGSDDHHEQLHALQHQDPGIGGSDPLQSINYWVNAPDAAPGSVISTGDQQGNIFSTRNGISEKAFATDLHCEVAPSGSGLTVEWEYGDTGDLDTVSSWTLIRATTLPSGSMSVIDPYTNVDIPADRLIRTNWPTADGSPANATSLLTVARYTGVI